MEGVRYGGLRILVKRLSRIPANIGHAENKHGSPKLGASLKKSSGELG